MRAVRIIVRGRVQGVGFRDWAVGEARALGLVGWVRNCSDGSVEMLAAGAPGAVDRLVAAARRGPAFARVAELTTEDAEAEVPDGFERRPTV